MTALLRIIGREGFASVSTNRLADAVGMTPGALFRHFDSLQDMLREAVRRTVIRVEETLPDPELPPLQRLLSLASARARLLASDPGVAWLLRSDEALLVLPEDAAEQLRGLVRKSQRAIRQALEDGAANRTIRQDIPPAVLQVMVSGTIHAVAGSTGVHRTGRRRKRRAPSLDSVLTGLTRILTPRSKWRKP